MGKRLRLGALTWILAAIGCAAANPAVSAQGAYPSPGAEVEAGAGSEATVAQGKAAFNAEFTPDQGLGPLYNAQSCVACHSSPSVGGMGPGGLAVVLRVGRTGPAGFDPLLEDGGPVARAHSVAELGRPCTARPGIPARANLTSVRNAPALFGLGLIDSIPDEVIVAGAKAGEDGVRGRPNLVLDSAGVERVGRFGWKADTATLQEFVAVAFRNELGITNPIAPQDPTSQLVGDAPRCAGDGIGLEDDGTLVNSVTAFVASLSRPARQTTAISPQGEAIFRDTGCTSCHTPSLRAADQDLPIYSDLLLHDMGPTLDDGVIQGRASGRDWRTTPLSGLSIRTRFLHDGRATSPQEAILAHAGEADRAAQRFKTLSPEDRALLLDFLRSL